MKKPKAYIWDYRHKKDETYDSGGWILVDKDKGFSIVVEVHEYTPRPAYKIESTELTELEIELVNKKKYFEPAKVEDMLKDVLTSRYVELSEELKEELIKYKN